MWIQIAMWLILWWKPLPIVAILSKMFFAGLSLLDTKYIFVKTLVYPDIVLWVLTSGVYILAGVSLFAALGFLLYGGR
jgi:hypothetical protein